MIEQINIALEQKRSGNFSAQVIEAQRRRLTSEKREHKHQLKVMKNEHPKCVLSSEQDDIVNSLNYEGIVQLKQLYHFPDSDRLVCWSPQTK